MVKKYCCFLVAVLAAIVGWAQSNLPFTNKELEYQIRPDEVEMPGRNQRYTMSPESFPRSVAGKPPVTIALPDGTQKVSTFYPSGKLKSETLLSNGVKNGVSITYYESGNIQQEVPYKNDLIDGEKLYKAENGELVVKTQYSKGKRSGNRVIYYNSKVDPEKRVYAVTPYKNDAIDGTVKMYRIESGEYFLRYEASFKAGLPDGIWETYERGYLPASGGNKYVTPVVFKKTEEWNSKGKRSGIKKEFRPDGTVKLATAFVNNETTYIESFDATGKSLYKNQFEQGKGVGIHQYYHENGQLSARFNMVDGKRVGEALYYYQNGQLEERVNFVDDRREGPFVNYYENGNKKKEGTYGNGYQPIGAYTEYFQEGGIHTSSERDDKGKVLSETYYDRQTKKRKVVMLYELGVNTATEYYDSTNHLIWTNHFKNGKKLGLYRHYDYRDRLATQSHEIENKTGYVFQYDDFSKRLISEKYTINGATVTKELFLNQYNIINDLVTPKTGN